MNTLKYDCLGKEIFIGDIVSFTMNPNTDQVNRLLDITKQLAISHGIKGPIKRYVGTSTKMSLFGTVVKFTDTFIHIKTSDFNTIFFKEPHLTTKLILRNDDDK